MGDWREYIVIALALVGGGGAVGFLNWLRSRSYKEGEIDTEVRVIKDKLEKLPCEKNGEIIQSIKEKLVLLEANNQMLSSIKVAIDNSSNNTDAVAEAVTVKNSPLRITPLGEKVYEIIKAKKTVEENLDFFISELEKQSPKTAYDVEAKIVSLLYGLISSKQFDEIKNYLYVSPDIVTIDGKKIRMSMDTAIKLMGIIIRDEYLKRNPEIMESIEKKP